MNKTIKHILRHKTELLTLAIVLFEFSFPHIGYAATAPATSTPNSVVIISPIIHATPVDSAESQTVQLIVPTKDEVPAAPKPVVVATHKLIITAYSSTIDQTDGDPCHTANGFNVCTNNEENVVAANFLPFGTKIRIPEYFGDRIFVVQDRMNKRHGYRVDVWLKTRQAALKLGVKYTTIEVVK